MFNHRNRGDVARREILAEQRRREDTAPRLRDVVPALRGLVFRFQDSREEGRSIALPYTRHVVLATAPALFSFRCIEPSCNGRHELTAPILKALQSSALRTEGESICQGYIGEVPCDRTLIYVCEAEYED
jgi:hypothetical protein